MGLMPNVPLCIGCSPTPDKVGPCVEPSRGVRGFFKRRFLLSSLFLPEYASLRFMRFTVSRTPNMRGLDDSADVFLRTGQKAQKHVRRAWEGFINFAARDNVLEVALGLM